MSTILRLSRQLVDCLRRVVGHRFHSQHIGGRWGSEVRKGSGYGIGLGLGLELG